MGLSRFQCQMHSHRVNTCPSLRAREEQTSRRSPNASAATGHFCTAEMSVHGLGTLSLLTITFRQLDCSSPIAKRSWFKRTSSSLWANCPMCFTWKLARLMSWVADRAYASRGPIPCCTSSEPIASLILTHSRCLSLPRLYAPNYTQRQGRKWQGGSGFPTYG